MSLIFAFLSCFSQNSEPVDYFVKYKLNNITYKTLFLKSNDSKYSNLFMKYLNDSTVSVRGFEKQTDSVVLHDNAAEFRFYFYKGNKPANYKEIYFAIEDNFSLSPKEYKIADYDLDNSPGFENGNNGYNGSADFSTQNDKLSSFQYTWVKNHRPAKWTITKVDTAAKTISGTFSFTVTYAENNGDTDLSKRETFKKIIEADITDGEFCLPYTIIIIKQ